MGRVALLSLHKSPKLIEVCDDKLERNFEIQKIDRNAKVELVAHLKYTKQLVFVFSSVCWLNERHKKESEDGDALSSLTLNV